VKRSVRVPVAVKLAPLLTAFAHFAKALDAAGADGLVLFTRFHRVDIDAWMAEREWTSLADIRGNMSFERIPDPAAYERENFRMALR
jgi:dihydroorotate dehydrogenase